MRRHYLTSKLHRIQIQTTKYPIGPVLATNNACCYGLFLIVEGAIVLRYAGKEKKRISIGLDHAASCRMRKIPFWVGVLHCYHAAGRQVFDTEHCWLHDCLLNACNSLMMAMLLLAGRLASRASLLPLGTHSLHALPNGLLLHGTRQVELIHTPPIMTPYYYVATKRKPHSPGFARQVKFI